MTEFMIRTPEPHEAKDLADLHLRTWEETYSGVFPPAAWDDDARTGRVAMWEAICTRPRPHDRIAVAERDGELIGFGGSGSSTEGSRARARLLFFIYVVKAEHGSGAGQALLDSVLSDDPASLWVLENNSRAIAFYARNGFTLDGVRREPAFDSGVNEVRMVR